MFGKLKDKLKAMIDKVSGKIEKEDQTKRVNVNKLAESGSKDIEIKIEEVKETNIQEKPEGKIDIKEIDQIIEQKPEPLEEKHEEIKPEKTVEQEPAPVKEHPKTEDIKDLIKKVQNVQTELDKTQEIIIEDLTEKKEKLDSKKSSIEAELLIKEDEKIVDDIEKEKEELEKVKQIIIEEKKVAEPREVKKLEKSRFSIIRKITEKTLEESEIKEILEEIHHTLLEHDVALEVVDKICDDVSKSLAGKTVKRGEAKDVIESALKSAVFNVLSQEKIDIENIIESRQEPVVVIFLGFNGAGKTTTLARLANKYKKYKPVLAAGDTFRAASIEQLEIHAKNLNLDIVKHRYGADAAAVIFDAKKHAVSKGSKLVLADTAGRSHSNVNLMDELKKVCRVNKPDIKILVLDALTGNDIYEQAKRFDEAVGVDAIILTKTDVYEKGGAALSAAYTTKKPILFLGIGQDYKDLQEFDAEKIVNNLLG